VSELDQSVGSDIADDSTVISASLAAGRLIEDSVRDLRRGF
jgi:hypothetical protein